MIRQRIAKKMCAVSLALAALMSAASASAQWTTLAPAPQVRSQHATLPDSTGKIHIIAGFGAAGSATSTHQVYTPSTNMWTSAAAYPLVARGMFYAAGPNGKLYVGGGADNASNILNSFYVYDPALDNWTQLPNLPLTSWEARADFGVDGKL